MANFDSLPDGLLCFIFSKLCLAQAVASCLRTGQIGGKLLALKMWSQTCLLEQHVRTSLERLTLVDPNLATPQRNRLVYLSNCKKLQWLNLCYAFIPSLPPQCEAFDMLTSCSLDLVVITDSALTSFVQLCPFLECLRLNSCTGLQSPHIRAPSLRCLEFVSNLGCVEPIQRICADAPNLQHVFLSYVEELRTEGEGLLELDLMCHVKPSLQLLPLLSSLSMHGPMWNLDSISEYIRLGPSVQVLYIDVKLEEKKPVKIDQFFGHLQNLKTMYIGSEFFECLQAGAKLSSTMRKVSLPSLEEITVAVTRGDPHCITILSMVLRCSSSLKKLQINAESLENSTENAAFFTCVLALQRIYVHVEILLTCPSSLL
ncbi:hypothetical protein GOP47_0017771 [Adiantum capillus-veneris]|uniref:F-box/LRR-repeat protein 15/At3g58940/PEG3-like LRR domain-containing protein n=1 Tax=Adiantum capillus-veneris TaxID=13818 RepID=A0A9D4UG01_ADICA|nr:hypothetical protein GOP47_0017771 [Adiantum capillus-veneris]